MALTEFTSATVLIVDDSEYIRTILTALFKKAGITNLHLASDGAAAVEKFKESHPDLVILDLMLPKKHGMDVLKEIRNMNSNAKVIIISSLATPENVEEAKKAGASYYFVKPYDNNKFLSVVKEVLSKKGEVAS